MPHIQAVTRSVPMPKPEWGTEPYLRSSKIPLEGFFGQIFLADSCQQSFVAAHALRAAADFAVAFGGEQVHRLADFGTTRPRFHVKGFDRAWVAVDKNGLVELLGDGGLVRSAEVHAPLEGEQCFLLRVGFLLAEFVDHLRRVVVGDAREGGFDIFQLGDVAPEEFQLRGAVADDALGDVGHHLLFDFHQAVEVAEGDFGFEHPELGQVAAGLGFFGAEGGSVAVDFPEGEDVGFVVELTCLREIGFAFVEVFGLEEGSGAFGGGWESESACSFR